MSKFFLKGFKRSILQYGAVFLIYIFINSGALFSKTVRVLNSKNFRYSMVQSYLKSKNHYDNIY